MSKVLWGWQLAVLLKTETGRLGPLIVLEIASFHFALCDILYFFSVRFNPPKSIQTPTALLQSASLD
jgi:hypothetical protein